MTRYTYWLIGWCLLVSTCALAQPGAKKELWVKRAIDEIKLDGVMDEETWAEANIATDFHQSFPFDTSFALAKTEARISYDDNFIYAVGVMYDTIPGKNIITSLRRDFQGPEIDGFHLIFDTFADNNNAFNFALNPYGVQREGLVAKWGQWKCRCLLG